MASNPAVNASPPKTVSTKKGVASNLHPVPRILIVGFLVIVLVAIASAICAYYIARKHAQQKADSNSALSASKHTLPSGWLTYTAPDRTFTVELPCMPEPQTQKFSNETITLYRCVDNVNHIEYRVAYSKLPGTSSFNAEQVTSLLEDTEKGVQLANQGSALVSSKSTTYNGYPALDYVIKTSSGNYYTFRSVIVDHSFFEIGTLSLSNKPSYYDQFVQSLKPGNNL